MPAAAKQPHCKPRRWNADVLVGRSVGTTPRPSAHVPSPIKLWNVRSEYYRYNAFGSVTVLPVYDRNDSTVSHVQSDGTYYPGVDDIPGSGSRSDWDLIENTAQRGMGQGPHSVVQQSPLDLSDNNTLMHNRRTGAGGHGLAGEGYGRAGAFENEMVGEHARASHSCGVLCQEDGTGIVSPANGDEEVEEEEDVPVIIWDEDDDSDVPTIWFGDAHDFEKHPVDTLEKLRLLSTAPGRIQIPGSAGKVLTAHEVVEGREGGRGKLLDTHVFWTAWWCESVAGLSHSSGKMLGSNSDGAVLVECPNSHNCNVTYASMYTESSTLKSVLGGLSTALSIGSLFAPKLAPAAGLLSTVSSLLPDADAATFVHTYKAECSASGRLSLSTGETHRVAGKNLNWSAGFLEVVDSYRSDHYEWPAGINTDMSSESKPVKWSYRKQ